MLRGTRPTATLVASLVVLTGALTACGGSDTPGTGLEFADRLDAVTISGDIGDAKLDFKQRMSADEVESDTLVTGTGAALKDGDKVFVNYVVGDGYTRKAAIDSFGADAPAVEVTVGATNDTPQSFDDVLTNAIGSFVKAGVTKGSRIAVTGDPKAVLGPLSEAQVVAEGLVAQGIGNADGLVVVIDVEDVKVLDGPEGTVGKSPGWAPQLVFNGNGPTGFDFAGVEEPAEKAKLVYSALKTGPGKKVEKGDLVVLDYLGAVYGRTKPFDESYSKEPISSPVGGFVEGFNRALEGQTVGSRILMRIPPALGYKDQAQGKQIPANSTLYFVVDILAAV
ncbi:FKBP-type peptidyl-prolyl cis-trans isomerase [Nocardioides rubriscoriae]|uniref:FKBP-type peptidyl-prolyl cis-trans isomerase n=1 Tax=Nocardioides rubriscoriae TaxID=642762 RepID=UPI0011DF7C5B|nr:FKBP-type peptidyl-prolyl cis-trans isomerase [Nocardioides rubriscoriae]